MSVLQEPCLILNRNWQAITFLPVQTAITIVLRDMGAVVDPESYRVMGFDEWIEEVPREARWIKTPSRRVPAPEVIVLKKYGERPPRRIAFCRVNLAKRDEFACQYCGARLSLGRGVLRVTIDHVLPRSRGGENSWENCVAACESCNSRKADRTPTEAGMKLKREPARPRWKASLRAPGGEVRASWVPFLGRERVA